MKRHEEGATLCESPQFYRGSLPQRVNGFSSNAGASEHAIRSTLTILPKRFHMMVCVPEGRLS